MGLYSPLSAWQSFSATPSQPLCALHRASVECAWSIITREVSPIRFLTVKHWEAGHAHRWKLDTQLQMPLLPCSSLPQLVSVGLARGNRQHLLHTGEPAE